MARIEFVSDLRRDGACGTWGAIVLGNGGQCAAMRLPVSTSERAAIDRVLAATRELMVAGVQGVAPVAVVAVGGEHVWIFVGIAPGPSIADVLYDRPVGAAELARVALDSGRTLADLHNAGLSHGSFGPETIVVSRAGLVRVTEAGIGPALAASSNGAATNGGSAARTNAAATGDADDVVGADVAAWARTVRLFGNHLRAAGDAAADAFGSCAAAAEADGLGVALERLDRAAQRWHGYRGQDGLADIMDGYAMADEPETTTILQAIDALFDADEPAPPPPPPPARAIRSPLRRGGPTADSLSGAVSTAFGGDVLSARRSAGGAAAPSGPMDNGMPQRVPPASELATATAVAEDAPAESAARAMTAAATSVVTETALDETKVADTAVVEPAADTAVVQPAEAAATETVVAGSVVADSPVDEQSAADTDGSSSGATAPPRAPRKTSVIPTRRPRTAGSADAPNGLWAPGTSNTSNTSTGATKATAPVRTPAAADPDATDQTVRVGRGVPASNGRRPIPARLGRPVWLPRLAINVVLAGVLVLGIGGYVWWRLDRPLRVTTVSLTVEKHVASACQLDADVVGTVITSGGKGTFTYQWRRSDGTTTKVYTAHVADPSKPTEVHLEWTFNGTGAETAEVELLVLGPERRSASTSFEYLCGS